MSRSATFKVFRYGPNTFFVGGELDLATVTELLEALEPSVQRGGSILLDVGAVTFIDSTGIKAIVDTAVRLGDQGCVFVHAPQRNVLRTLQLVGIGDVPNIHLDVCPSDGFPDDFLDWRTPEGSAEEFAQLRELRARSR